MLIATLGCRGCSWEICCWTPKQEPEITRSNRAEMEEFETRLEGDFISRDGLREGKLGWAWSIAWRLALDAGQADDSEFRVGQPTVFLTIVLKRPLRLHIELSSQKSPRSNDMLCGICLSSRLCPSIDITTIPSTDLRRKSFAFLTVSLRLSRCPREIRQPKTLRRYSMPLQPSTRG